MTPDVQAAAERVRAYVEALEHERVTLGSVKTFYVDGRIDERHGTDGKTHVLYLGDLGTLVAALDAADAPINHIPTPRGINYLELRREQHPRHHTTGPS